MGLGHYMHPRSYIADKKEPLPAVIFPRADPPLALKEQQWGAQLICMPGSILDSFNVCVVAVKTKRVQQLGNPRNRGLSSTPGRTLVRAYLPTVFVTKEYGCVRN